MHKLEFIKDFQYARKMQRVMRRLSDETDLEYERRTRLSKYGLDGEDRVYYQLKNIRLSLFALSDIRIIFNNASAQADFVVVAPGEVYLIEVKNLYGHIRVMNNGDIIRIIEKKGHKEETGMINPFSQIHKQASAFCDLLVANGYTLKIKELVVMANPKTIIYGNEKNYPIIRFDNIDMFFYNNVKDFDDYLIYKQMKEIANIILIEDKPKEYNSFNKILQKCKESFNKPAQFIGDDLRLYEEILEYRRDKARKIGIPVCNVFINQNAENLVLYKPLTKDEFMKVPGFKEKKYMLYGEDIIAIIKKYCK